MKGLKCTYISLYHTRGQPMLHTECLGSTEISIVFTSICTDPGLIAVDVERINRVSHLYIDSWFPLHWLQSPPPTGSSVDPLYINWQFPPPHPTGSVQTWGQSMWIVDPLYIDCQFAPRICMDLGLIHMDCWSPLHRLLIHPQDPCRPGAELHRLLIPSKLTVNCPPPQDLLRLGDDLHGLLIFSMSTVDWPPYRFQLLNL